MNIYRRVSLWLLCVLVSTHGSNAFARTEYVVLERHSDIHIFELYLDYLATTNDPLEVVKKIKMEDAVRSDLRKKYYNTISEVRYSSDGHVVVENKQYNFQINFEYGQTANSILWTCTIARAAGWIEGEVQV